METKTTKQRQFDVAEYAAKVRTALEKLEQTQKPGEQSGSGSKTQVLEAAKKEIRETLAKGYTAKQIADAMREDVFSILPKTITELAATKKTVAKQPTVKKTEKQTDNKQAIKTTTTTAPTTRNTDNRIIGDVQ